MRPSPPSTLLHVSAANLMTCPRGEGRDRDAATVHLGDTAGTEEADDVEDLDETEE